MSLSYAPPLANLIAELAKLPGIGEKTAQRLAYHILALEDDSAIELAEAIISAKREMRFCSVCGNLSDIDPCELCSDSRRDDTIICVVENPRDIGAIERTREYRGRYHVLGGVISPMDGTGPEDLNIKNLIVRLQKETTVVEIILATNPTIEGEATAMYIAHLIKPTGIKVSRIAHGVPMGGDIEYTDGVTLSRAIEDRREI